MKSTILDARTVSIVRPLKVEKRQGANGEFESKDVLVRIAVDRDYKVTRQENGKTISEYPTDFWLAKFTGPVAQTFADHCCSTKEDGKLVSRHLLLNGNFENYDSTRKVKVNPQVNIGGQLYQLDLEVDVVQSNTIFVVDSMKFLDKNPNAVPAQTGTTVTTASITPVGVAPAPQAVAVPAPVAPAQPAQVAVPAPVVPTQVAQPAPVAQTVDLAGTTATPVVDPNFVPNGETAPF